MLLPSNVSSNSIKSPTNVEGDSEGLMYSVPVSVGIPEEHEKKFALVTSLSICNKTTSDISVWVKLSNGSSSATLVNGISIPPSIPYDLIHGNKFTMKEGDSLYIWHNDGVNSSPVDAILSYTLHVPLTTYDV
jgi:hypothetical protein